MYTTRIILADTEDNLEHSDFQTTSAWTTFKEAVDAAKGQLRLSIITPNDQYVFASVTISSNNNTIFHQSYEVRDPSTIAQLAHDLNNVEQAPRDMEFILLRCYHTDDLFTSVDDAMSAATDFVNNGYVDVVLRRVPVSIPYDVKEKDSLDAAKKILGIDVGQATMEDVFAEDAEEDEDTKEAAEK